MRRLLSTTEAPSPAAATQFAAERAWRLNPQVALRDEAFGALAYHYGNRRLTFLRDAALVSLVRDLGRHPSVDDALEAASIDVARRPSFRKALGALASSEVIRAR